MNYIITLTLCIFAFPCFSQLNRSGNYIDLNKGQKISIVTTIDGTNQLGQENKTKLTVTTLLTVVDSDKSDYVISDRVTKMASEDDSFINYDETISTPQNTDIKNHLPHRKQSVNKFTGKVTYDEKINSTDIPVDFFDDYIIQHTFLFIPSGKKAGDSWLVKDSSRECTYTLLSTMGDFSTVSFEEKYNENKTFQVNGMQLNSHTSNISTGQITINHKLGLVKSRTANTITTGTVDMMGNLMDVKTKNSSVSIFYYR